MRVALILTAFLFLATPLAARQAAEPELARFAGEVRIVLPLASGVLVAGPGPERKAWLALLDSDLEPRFAHRFADCGRCSLLAAARLGEERVVLAGARDERGDGVEEGWVVLVDARSGEILRQRIVRPPAGGRFLAAAAGFGRLLVAGEMFTDAGAGLDAWMVELDPGTLEPVDEWRFGGVLPDAAGAVLPVAADAFIAAGWSFSAETGMLGGWVARFGPDPQPLWKTLLDGETAFDMAALARLEDGDILAVGHESRPDSETRSLAFDLRAARLDARDGTLRDTAGLRDPAIDRMGVALLAGEPRALVLAARQAHPDGPDALELFALSPAAGFRPLHVWRDGEGATVPAAMAVAGEGSLLVGGWYRMEEGTAGPRGWLARFSDLSLPAVRPRRETLFLQLEPAAEEGYLRVVLENRGMAPLEVQPLAPETVYWLPPGAEPPAQIGAMPARPPDPLAEAGLVTLRPGGRLEAVLHPKVAPEELRGVRAAYSPDFPGRGIGRLIVSAPFRAPSE